MGKRKRSATPSDHTPSDFVPCSSGRDLPPGENVLDAEESDIFKPHSFETETMDSHAKHSNSQISLGQHHYNLNRSMFLKRSRHHYGNQYSRRNLPNHHKPSTSFGKSSPFRGERLCFKLGSGHNTELARRPDLTEFQERAFWRPERIRSSTSAIIDAAAPDGVKTVCGLCQKSLRRKPHHFGGTLASEELSIVAVLVCGHIYHAECLEQKTCLEDVRDPPCPICSDFTLDPEPA
ncbi:hypothetical protein RND81_07G111900 [Saponaria officinalis]|uniref:RING-type domain-containing protein n=1 Tax=Saponaria officinalis TaxID=3572 RepID=A0AAW1JM91_SAPOF